jgi:hypothetical protein
MYLITSKVPLKIIFKKKTLFQKCFWPKSGKNVTTNTFLKLFLNARIGTSKFEFCFND